MSNEELTGRELDIAIVERVMGWLPPSDPATKAMRSRLRLTHPSYNDHYLTPEGELRKPPYYSVDAAATMEMEDQIEVLGLQYRYALLLAESLPSWHGNTDMTKVYWEVAHASLEQRCRTALASLPEIKGL